MKTKILQHNLSPFNKISIGFLRGPGGSFLVLSDGRSIKGVFKGTKDRKLLPHSVLLVEVVSSITKGLAGIGVMWSHSGHYLLEMVFIGSYRLLRVDVSLFEKNTS